VDGTPNLNRTNLDHKAPNAASAPATSGWKRLRLSGARDQIRTGIPFAGLRPAHTRCSLIARTRRLRLLPLSSWHALKPEGPIQGHGPSSRHKKAAPLRGTAFLCMEHETRFELASGRAPRRIRDAGRSTRCSLIARSSPSSWQVVQGFAQAVGFVEVLLILGPVIPGNGVR